MSHLVIRSWTFLRNYTLMPAHCTTHTHTLSLYHTQVVLSDTATHTDTPSLYHTQIHTHPQSMTLLHTPTLFHFTTLRSYSRPHAFHYTHTHTLSLYHTQVVLSDTVTGLWKLYVDAANRPHEPPPGVSSRSHSHGRWSCFFFNKTVIINHHPESVALSLSWPTVLFLVFVCVWARERERKRERARESERECVCRCVRMYVVHVCMYICMHIYMSEVHTLV